MAKKFENKKRTQTYYVLPEKKETTDVETTTVSCEPTNSELSMSRNTSFMYYVDKKTKLKTRNSILKSLIRAIGYFFGVLAIVCAWGAIDSLIDIISGKQVHVSLMCYSTAFIIGFLILIIYIFYVDRTYTPEDYI